MYALPRRQPGKHLQDEYVRHAVPDFSLFSFFEDLDWFPAMTRLVTTRFVEYEGEA